MALSTVFSRAQHGIEAPLVRVETHISGGLPAFSIVGLPEAAVRESKERVRSAIINSHLEFPQQRLTINLAPADLPKHGGRFDLPIALGILLASGQLPNESVAGMEFVGELALGGNLRPVSGCVGAAIAAGQSQRKLALPKDNRLNHNLIPGARVLAANSLLELMALLQDEELAQNAEQQNKKDALASSPAASVYPDLADVIGQARGKRALEIAAAGGHNILLFGPPGTGKTMLASRLPGILPPLEESELLDVLTISSVTDKNPDLMSAARRPFRCPHHSASAVSMVGGGRQLQPGEITRAHGGVLFLDELPEFPRSVLEMLREPLENGLIRITRASGHVTYPARFQLVAAMNPCPCGYSSDPRRACSCSPTQIQQYLRRISGPLLDRIDLIVELPRADIQLATVANSAEETSDLVKERVTLARQRQLKRNGYCNAQLTQREIHDCCQLKTADQKLLERAAEKEQLSVRACFRILKSARTIADLDGCTTIERPHLLEALSFKQQSITGF